MLEGILRPQSGVYLVQRTQLKPDRANPNSSGTFIACVACRQYCPRTNI